VQTLAIVRNDALVKGTLHTWYNRFVKLVLKVDHAERFLKSPPAPESRWWSWSYCERAQTVELRILPAKPKALQREAYDLLVAPLQEALRLSMDSEVEDPDPMSRVSVGL